MNHPAKKVRALGLCSGGLDSILSALVLRRQDIDVAWVSFDTPFFPAVKAHKASERNNIPLRVEKITADYIEMLKNPNCGYGQQMNPCLDCHALMFQKAGQIMRADGFDFLFSGEVLGQRPMSQTKPSLRYVEKNSGFDGYILRPLSAKKLPETIPEQQGLVDRSRLLDISGRGRKRQIALAKEFGVTDYPAPAGGCLLTDKGYSARLRDLFKHQSSYTEDELNLLKYGRHFRLNPETRLIVGRTQQENEAILKHQDVSADISLNTPNHPGPTALLPKGAAPDMVLLAAAICAGYSKVPKDVPVAVQVTALGGVSTITVIPVLPRDVAKFLILS
ncbi:Possible RNA methyltransferase aq_898 [Olavius algarvensis associated proteobacterium Delta 3]|nr:Possible RNA methyltransferase aq_898 [Olavius algarvensis associated proteobacterium Delta 3]CAB5164731.1 Possible RNA methyltransferase aq_898 [Olavius algarvensis associated proteobacterium Delta 3]